MNTTKPIRSFSQAAAWLEERGIRVEAAGRATAAGALTWRVQGERLTKEQVIARAQALADTEQAREVGR